MAVPIIPRSGDLTSPAPVIIYSPPQHDTPSHNDSTLWRQEVPFPDKFRLIHDIKVISAPAPAFDSVLVAGREGICYLYASCTSASIGWDYVVVGTGLPRQGDNPFWGSGSVDVGRVDDDPVGYIATCEVRLP